MYGKFIKDRDFVKNHIVVEGKTIKDIKEKYDKMYRDSEDFVVLNSHQEDMLFNMKDEDDKFIEVIIYHNSKKEYRYLNQDDIEDIGF